MSIWATYRNRERYSYFSQPTKRSRSNNTSLETVRRIGTKMILEKKAEVLATKDVVERKDVTSRDLLSLLIKSNMATDLQESERMSDEEILSRRFLSSK